MEEQKPILSGDKRPVEFGWIIDDNLLRDEGVIFGLSEGDVEQKVDAIQHYYEERIQELTHSVKGLEEEISGSDQVLDTIQQSILQQEAELKTLLPLPPPTQHTFWRAIFGFGVYALVLTLCFFLIQFWFEGDWLYTSLIGLGLYLFGGILLYNDHSLFFKNDPESPDSREPWKKWLEELGVPFVVTAFIMAWGYDGESIIKTATLALLLFTLFLFAGKGFLSSFDKLRDQFRLLQKEFNERQWKRGRIKQLQAELEKKLVEQQDVLAKKEHLKESLKSKKSSLCGMGEKRAAKIALFRSEYELARSARLVLDDDQIQLLTSRKF